MNNVLILYPSPFKCQTKFDRKVDNILSNMNDFVISYFDDENGLINSFLNTNSRDTLLEQISREDYGKITHAIVFDDDEELQAERGELRNRNVPTRWIKIPITRVINIRRETDFENLKSTPEYEYIGRGSYWGNPYSMFEEGESRERVIEKYKYDFDYEKFPNKDKKQVFKLSGKRLGCFCKPLACHGDVLADFLNSWDDGK